MTDGAVPRGREVRLHLGCGGNLDLRRGLDATPRDARAPRAVKVVCDRCRGTVTLQVFHDE